MSEFLYLPIRADFLPMNNEDGPLAPAESDDGGDEGGAAVLVPSGSVMVFDLGAQALTCSPSLKN